MTAELTAILMALLSNKNTELTIKLSSLTVLNLICNRTTNGENLLWHEITDADLIKTIVHELRIRPEPCSLQWVRVNGDRKDPNMIAAQKLTKDTPPIREDFVYAPRDHNNSRALHDGAKLSSLEMKDAYSIIVSKHTAKLTPLLHPERLESAKNEIEIATGLWPTNCKLIMGIWNIPVYPRLRDLLWNLLVGRLRIGKYWQNLPGYEERAHCAACRRQNGEQTTEDETHLWTTCEHNGQKRCWNYAKHIWQKCTPRPWLNVNIDLI